MDAMTLRGSRFRDSLMWWSHSYESHDRSSARDAIAITEHYVAVIDGATDKSGQLIDGKPPGKAIVNMLCDQVLVTDRLGGLDVLAHRFEDRRLDLDTVTEEAGIHICRAAESNPRSAFCGACAAAMG